jgi:malto-oligosyltrehalose synthase
MIGAGPSVPASTYRLQLHHGFDFAAARAIVPYLAELGVTHVYLSPITAAVPGSQHGYDVVDPTRLNPELGGEKEYRAFAEELRRYGLRQLMDIVPNHMGAAAENRWWIDVLRRGPESPYARVYDIDWTAADGEAARLVLPVLGDTLEQVIERGEIQLTVVDGEPYACYFEQLFPLSAESIAGLAAAGENPGETVARLSALTEDSSDRTWLRGLLDAQHYRLGYWRAAKPRVNYRRFFVIDELVGVRVEDPPVFALTHSLPLRLVSEGTVQALRIDHVDGLADPAAYLRELQAAAMAGNDARDQPVTPYVVVEKILGEDEPLPEHWACAGTSGYDFMRDVNAVLVDTGNAEALTAVYEGFTGRSTSPLEVADQCRRAIVQGPLAGQLRGAAALLHESSSATARNIDLDSFARALQALLACIDVYRTYHTAGALDPEAERVIEGARSRALLNGADEQALDFVASLLSRPPVEAIPAIERLQQLMPTVQAKGIEDMACYRYARLLALSEVGSAFGRFGIDVDTFHMRNQARHDHWPATMLATATHDHKRGEDARARLDVLSELPSEWADCLERWSRMTAGCRPRLIDRQDEYVLHQVLLGAWPSRSEDPVVDAEFVVRVQDYLVKFAREAAERTSWAAPDRPYEDALRQFASAVLDPAQSAPFLADRQAFQLRISQLGAINSLGQTLLKVASPGVPDVYQGTELWDLSLVDPDNRRPVDYAGREAVLEGLLAGSAPPMLSSWQDGAVKMHVLASALRLRRASHPFLIDADYVPLRATGDGPDHVLAFGRALRGHSPVIAAAARLPATLCGPQGSWEPHWRATALHIPAGFGPSGYRDVLTGRAIAAEADGWGGYRLRLEELLQVLPVVLLQAE